MRISGLFIGLTFMTIATVSMRSQSPTAQNPSFEVSSIKTNRLVRAAGPPSVASYGSRFTASNATLRMLVQFAYRPEDGRPLRSAEIIGAPDWADVERFDVEAKTDRDGRSITPEHIQQMIQTLLADRFQLRGHWTRREAADIYTLVVGKDGPKLKLSDDQSPPTRASTASSDSSSVPVRGRISQIAKPSVGMILLTISGAAIPVSPDLVGLLQGYAGRPIIDQTNLKGLFDIRFQFALDASGPAATQPLPTASDRSGPTIFTAVQEQLGLRLESSKGPVEVLIIDHAEKPSEN